ncbi:hypothetical protein SLS55_007875 [Diplodia seriata]|uniref:Zn(2)-C6 fungal-type domain-containing protein n=1 Tax=Diplodia seriata TaxID=420778 RepID=A0ABR3C8U5_9PEZI
MSETADATAAGTTKDNTKAKAAADSTNTKARKRTKTGCLTCRRRRIKCGEERPICNNCVKSKRQCEGYNQRVIFKPPIGDWPGSTPASTLPYHSGVIPGDRPVFQQPFPGPQSSGMPYGALQPGQQQYPLPQYGQFTGVDPFSGGAFTSGLVQDGSYVAQAPPYSQPMDPSYQQRSYSMGAMQPEYSRQIQPQPSYPSQAHRQSVHLPYHTTANMGQGIPAYSPPPQTQQYGQQNHAPHQTQYSQGIQYPAATTAADTYRQPLPLTQTTEVLHAADQDVLVWQKLASARANEEERLALQSPESVSRPYPGMSPQFSPDAGQTGIGMPFIPSQQLCF